MQFHTWLLALVAVYAIADRWCGGGLGWDRVKHDAPGGFLHGRPTYYAILPLLGLGWLIAGLVGLLLALAWLVYRSAFGFWTGTLTGVALPLTLVRHLIITALAAAIFWKLQLSFYALLPTAAYAVAATVLAVVNGREAAKGHDVNAVVESTRGALWGGALWGCLFLGGLLVSKVGL